MKKIKYTALILCLFTVLSLLSGCGNETDGSIPVSGEIEYSVTVQTEGGMPLKDVQLMIYEADDREDLVTVAKTDKNGLITFTASNTEKVALIAELPKGYVAESEYVFSEANTVITLSTSLLTGDDLENAVYGLGDVFGDYTVKAYDGREYKISQLLSQKKAVVLNFWFLKCDPCKMEFPYMQQAYEEYKDKIEIIAINPYDGTDETVEKYANDLGLTFPVASVGSEWQTAMSLTAYPTTVVIDRYGTVAMYHRGAITEKEIFVKIFEYFTADDYIQSTVRNISDIK